MEDQVEGQKKVQAIAALAGMVKSSAAEPVTPVQQPMNLDLFAEINNRLKTIEEKVTNLETTYEKILGSMLKSKAKTITIKFDEAQNTKQDGVRKPVSKSDK